MTVLGTGASRGIGRATAVRLGESRDVAVNYHSDQAGAAETVAEIEARDGRAVAVRVT